MGLGGGGGGGGGDIGRPTTPMSSSTGSGVPPPFDAAELGAYARESREVSYQFHFIGDRVSFFGSEDFAPNLHFGVRVL